MVTAKTELFNNDPGTESVDCSLDAASSAVDASSVHLNAVGLYGSEEPTPLQATITLSSQTTVSLVCDAEAAPDLWAKDSQLNLTEVGAVQ